MTYVEEALHQAGQLGPEVVGLFAPVRVYQDRAGQLRAALAELRAAGEAARAELVRGVAEGRVDPRQVPAQLAQLDVWGFDSPASKVLVGAAAAAHDLVNSAAVAVAPRVFELLQRIAASTVDESAELAASLPVGVRDERAAFEQSRGGAKHFHSWMRLTELVDVWVWSHRLVRTMRFARWIEGPQHAGQEEMRPQNWAMFGDPRRLPKGWAQQPAPLQLGLAVAAGAKPGLYSWADATARCRKVDRRLFQPMTKITVWDKRGAPTVVEEGQQFPQGESPLPAVSGPDLVGARR